MSAGPELDDIARRLVDLAESAGPWDDPLPEVRRRIEATTADPDSGSTGSSVFRSPRPARRSRRWFRSVDPEKAVAAAAVVTIVAGLGWVIHSGGGNSSEKSSLGGPALASSAAGAAGSGAATRAGQSRPVPGAATTAAGCGWPAPTSAVSLRAPAQVRTGAVVNVGVRLKGSAAADVYSPLVVVVSRGRVVGRLVAKVIPPGPSVRPSSPTAATTTVTGTLRRSTCAQAAAAFRSRVPHVAGPVLPPGRYQMFAVATAAGARVASAPITVTVIR